MIISHCDSDFWFGFLEDPFGHFPGPTQVPEPHFGNACLDKRQTRVHPRTFTLSGARLEAQVPTFLHIKK